MADIPPEDAAAEARRLHREYVEARFTQLSELESTSSDSVYHYLFKINAGAGVAVLTFIGTSPDIAKLAASHWSLGAFVAGVIMCGVFRALHIHWASRLFNTWRSNYDKYHRQQMTWEKVMEEDDKVERAPNSLWFFGYAAGICFLLGCFFALSILSELKDKKAESLETGAATEELTGKAAN